MMSGQLRVGKKCCFFLEVMLVGAVGSESESEVCCDAFSAFKDLASLDELNGIIIVQCCVAILGTPRYCDDLM